MTSITINTQDLHRIEEQKSLLQAAVSLIEDLSEELDNADLEDDVEEFLEQYRTLTHPMR